MKTLLFALLCLPVFLQAQLTAPVLIAPAHQATNQPSTLTLKWHKVTNADQYMVEVIKSGQQTPIVSDTAYTDTMRVVTNLSPGLHYWRVKAKKLNPYQTSTWSAYWLFTVGNSSSLATPVLKSPSNGSLFQVTGTKLVWNAVAGATYYKVKVATNAAMTNVVFVDSNVVTTSRVVPNLTYNTQYFWHVVAANAVSQSATSAVWNLTTMPDNPNAVTTHPRLWFKKTDLTRLRSWAVPSNPIYVAMQTALASANNTYTTKFYPGGQPNPVWPDDGGVTWPTYCTEAYAQYFAFHSLIDPTPANRILYAQRARNLLMYVMDLAVLGAAPGVPFRDPAFANKDRMNAWGECYPLIVDWIYDAKDANNAPILTAADKAKIRTVFMRWANENVNGYNHPVPIGLVSDQQMLTSRKTLNNYYSGHARSMAMLSLALDAADDPVLDPALPASAMGNSLRSYLFNATGAWLYQQYSQYELAPIVAADYGIPANFPDLSSGSGGLSVEGALYGTSINSVSGGLLALKTAGWNDPNIVGKQAKLINSAYWTRFLEGLMHTAAPEAKVNPAAAYLGPIYPKACHGESIRTWVTPDWIKAVGTVGLLAEIYGNATQLKQARWYARNVIEGGAANLNSRVSNIWGNNAASQSILYYLLLKPNVSNPTDPRPAIATSFYDPSRPRLLARTNWTTTATWFNWQCPWIDMDHQLGDANQFELYRKGEWLIKERTGYGNDQLAYTSEFHNTLALQNDVPANLFWFETVTSQRGGQWILSQNAGDPTAITSIGNDFVYATGDATTLYNRPSATAANAATDIEYAVRSIVWLKPDHVIVYDRAKSKTANRFKRFFLQFTAPPVIVGKNATVTTPGGQKVYLSALLPATAVLSTSVSENFNAVAQLDPTHDQIKIEDPANPLDVRFLNVIQGADAAAAKSAVTLVQSTAGTAFQGVVVKNKAIMFPKVWNAPFASTTYSVRSTVTGQLVTGLTPNAGYDVSLTPVGINVSVTIVPGSQLTADAGGVLRIGTINLQGAPDDRTELDATEIDLQTAPNPFVNSTNIAYTLPKTAVVSLRIVDALGKTVAILTENETQAAGQHVVALDGVALPAGIYWGELMAGEKLYQVQLLKQ